MLRPDKIDLLVHPVTAYSLQLQVDIPQHPRHDSANFDPRQTLADAIFRTKAESLHGLPTIVRKFRGGLVQPSFRMEDVRLMKV